jgi:hypothetical protein
VSIKCKVGDLYLLLQLYFDLGIFSLISQGENGIQLYEANILNGTSLESGYKAWT